MTKNNKVVIIGCGHIGHYACHAIRLAPDMDLAGIVDLQACLGNIQNDFPGIPVAADVDQLPEKPDVAILACPTRSVEGQAAKYLSAGIRTVDCFDMHGEPFIHLKNTLDPIAKKQGISAIMGSGVDPGISTMVRALFEIWAPTGLTYVNYGPGMSMGHSVAARSYEGVQDALSITRPGDPGCHKRDLYLELSPDGDFEEIKTRILKDPYFSKDDVRIYQVRDVKKLTDMGHRIQVSRKGGSSGVDNQLLHFETTFHNPASTAQVLAASARAVMRLTPGAHTMLEVPLLYFLSDDLESITSRII